MLNLSKSKTIITPVVHDALTARIAEKLNFEAVWVGGFAVAGATYGLPDIGLTGLAELLAATRNIINAVNIPVLVDADNGYGNERNAAYTVSQLQKIGAAGCFIEDQKSPKRCGHLNGKELVTVQEMIAKLKAVNRIKKSSGFILCARTDAIAVEGLDKAIARAKAYIKAGANLIFIEAPETLDQLREIPRRVTEAPLLVNMLEGGKTPICSRTQLEKMGYKMIAYPVTTLFSAVMAVEISLKYLKNHGHTRGLPMISFSDYQKLVGINQFL
jgi:2-methylisocitrate lyase-like PEP mutase family enzyme